MNLTCEEWLSRWGGPGTAMLQVPGSGRVGCTLMQRELSSHTGSFAIQVAVGEFVVVERLAGVLCWTIRWLAGCCWCMYAPCLVSTGLVEWVQNVICHSNMHNWQLMAQSHTHCNSVSDRVSMGGSTGK